MGRVRYGARTVEELRRTQEAARSVPDVWSLGVTARWRTDADAVAAVLPPPLRPAAEPVVRVNISQVDLGGQPLGAGSVAAAARHGDVDGWYPLVMPMTTERALTGGREVFGEPKKLGQVTVDRTGDHVVAALARHDIAFVEVRAHIVEELPAPPPASRVDFYFKFLPAPNGTGFDNDPALVHCTRSERTRSLHRLEGEVLLGESPFDPVADLPVHEVIDIRMGERTSDQSGRIVERVPAEWIVPFAHQRYDDPLQVLDAAAAPGGRP